jgi:dihydrolipoamide dehydrogenase
VYAIGDLVRGPALAHKAQEEGVIAAEAIAGAPTHPLDPNLVAGATFCHPQVASVGLTEDEAKQTGREIKTARMKLGGVGAAAVYDDRDGIVKLVVDAEYGEIVGAHVVGNRACDMVAELVDTIALEGGYQELARIVHPHPTISEAVLEAARAVDGWAIHQ